MVGFINSWVKGIIVAVVISTIIEMILPEGTIKKYVKIVIGTYIVFVIISPIITKITGEEIKISSFELPEKKNYEQNVIDTNAYIETTYINTIKQDIIQNIEEKGYKVNNINIEVETEEKGYGNIKKVELDISKIKNQGGNIETVEINLSKTVQKDEVVTVEEIQKLKEYLEEIYGAKEININV